MAKPIVRLLLVASRAGNEPPDNDLVVRNPMVLVSADRLPWKVEEAAVYVQLSGGLGRWELAIEFGQRLDSGGLRLIGSGSVRTQNFGSGSRLGAWDSYFVFSNLPLRRAGLYEFRVIGRPADGPDGTVFEVLDGIHPGVPAVAELRVLEQGGQL